MSVKEQRRLDLLRRYTPDTPGSYVCTVPGCTHKQQDADGFCPQHDVPLRLLKRRP